MRKKRSENSKEFVSRMVTKNMIDLVEEEHLQSRRLSTQNRMANYLVSFAGTPLFFWFHILFFGAWIIWNTRVFGTLSFDPFPFEFLTLVVSLEAIVLSIFVLVAQNHMQELADRRAQLDLHINLLDERETTLILKKIARIEEHLKIPVSAEEKKTVEHHLEDINPTELLKTIEQIYQQSKK